MTALQSKKTLDIPLDNIAVSKGDVLTVWIAMLPTNVLSGKSLGFTLQGTINTYTKEFANLPSFEAGKAYSFSYESPQLIDLSESGSANCYIVPEAGTYKFKTVKGNTDVSVGEVKGIKVLWESFGTDTAPNVGDLIKADVSYADGYITFSTNDTYHKGNAVIAAYSDAGCTEGNVLWSWHIWLTDQPIEQEYTFDKGGKGVEKITIMDRNLGATSGTPGAVEFLGLLYQWGRKDPFLGSSCIYSKEIAPLAQSTMEWPSQEITDETKGTVDYVTKHPTTFLTTSQSPRSWSIPKNDNLWASEKTQYDPCPPGWRIQDVSFWLNFQLGIGSNLISAYFHDDMKTYVPYIENYADNIFCHYPASGYYNGSLMIAVGEEGHYWTCINNGFNLIRFQCGVSGNREACIVIDSREDRGCSVRCQKVE